MQKDNAFAPTYEIRIDPMGKIVTICSAVPNQWHVMGVTQAAGLSLKWIKVIKIMYIFTLEV